MSELTQDIIERPEALDWEATTKRCVRSIERFIEAFEAVPESLKDHLVDDHND